MIITSHGRADIRGSGLLLPRGICEGLPSFLIAVRGPKPLSHQLNTGRDVHLVSDIVIIGALVLFKHGERISVSLVLWRSWSH